MFFGVLGLLEDGLGFVDWCLVLVLLEVFGKGLELRAAGVEAVQALVLAMNPISRF